jgi:hypothetical protein
LRQRVAELFDGRHPFVRRQLTAAEQRHLARLVRGHRPLRSPTPEKALEFLDDRLLPATSNALERSNRRHRKMQRSVYRVRTQENLEGRLALDLQRERQAAGRQETLQNLHQQRAEGK